jgi:hypothetical protein
MKNDHQENGLLRGPLILMVPASNLVAVMSLDWLDDTNRAALSTKTRGRTYLANPPRTEATSVELTQPLSRAGCLTKGRELDELLKR